MSTVIADTEAAYLRRSGRVTRSNTAPFTWDEMRYLKAYLRYLLNKRATQPKLPNDSYPSVGPMAGEWLRGWAASITS